MNINFAFVALFATIGAALFPCRVLLAAGQRPVDLSSNSDSAPDRPHKKLLAFGGASPDSTPLTRSSPPPSNRMKQVELFDPAFQMVAYTFSIPEDWTFEGTILREESAAPAAVYRISSPDGLYGIQGMPTFNWFWGDNPAVLRQVRATSAKVMMPMSAKDFAVYILPLVRPEAKVGETQPTPNAEKWASMIAQQNQMAQQNSYGLPPMKVSGESVRVHMEYSLKGSPIEEWFVVQTHITENRLPSGIGTPPPRSFSCTAYVSTGRAPKGKLQATENLLREINASATPNPAWNQRQANMMRDRLNADNARVMESIRQRGQQTAAMLKANHEAYMAASTRRFDSVMQQDRDRMNAMDRSAAAYTLYAGEEQLVRNPNSGEVSRVSSNYSHAWENQQGGGVLLSNSNFDPNAYLRGSWTQLESVNPLKP